MMPCAYSETVAVTEVPAHLQRACVTYCDLETNKRCKTSLTIEPVVCPISFRDSVIVYIDSTRRRYVSHVDYVTRLRPTSFADTAYCRPRTTSRTFATWVEHASETHRKWYKSSVRLDPKIYSSKQECDIVPPDGGKSSEVSSLSLSSSSQGGVTDADASMESLEYLSDSAGSSLEVPSPLRLRGDGRDSLLDNGSRRTSPQGLTITTCSSVREVNGNDSDTLFGYGKSVTSHYPVTSHRSGPFIYNVPKRSGVPRGGATDLCFVDNEDYHRMTNGDGVPHHHQHLHNNHHGDAESTCNEVTGEKNCRNRHLEEELVSL